MHGILRDENFKHEKNRICTGSFFRFLQIFEKRAPTKAKCLLPVSQILRNFTEETQENSLSVLLLLRILPYKDIENTNVFPRARADHLSRVDSSDHRVVPTYQKSSYDIQNGRHVL